MENHFNEYRKELEAHGLSTRQDLLNLVKPLIKEAVMFKPLPAERPMENSQLISHFGGHPYFEKGESWPTMKDGQPLDFIFQVFNTGDINLPWHIKILQFYYCYEGEVYFNEADGWQIKTYSEYSPDKMELVPKPDSLKTAKFCRIDFSYAKTLPDWEELNEHTPLAAKLSSVLDEEDPWVNYGDVVKELTGKNDFQSNFGGYPHWVQGNDTPHNEQGKELPLLFQLDSEENAGLMWGDCGLIYIFYDPEKHGNYSFVFQCF